MQQVGQSSDGRRPSSPRGSSSSNMPQFCLLGQQLTYSSQQQQQQHQSPQHHQNPSNNNGNMNFSLGVHSQQQGQSLSPGQSQANDNGGGGYGGGGFANLQNVNSFVGAGQVFNQNHEFMNHQVLQTNTGVDFLKSSQLQQQAVQVLGTPVPSPEAFMNALQAMQQNIGQLQAMVPLLTQNHPQLINPLGWQQAAAAAGAVRMITQLAQAAASIFPVAQLQQQQHSLSDPHQMSQLLGESVAPGLNFFQQQNGSSPMVNAAGDDMGNSNVSSRQGVNVGTQANSLMGQRGGLPSGTTTPSNVGSGLGGQKGFSAGQKSFGGQQGGGNMGSGASSGSDVGMQNNKHGSSGNNQLGMGISRMGAVGGEMSHINQTSMNTGLTTSSMEDHEGGSASRGEDDDGDTESLPPGSYELVELDAMEILAEHTHFCEICGKGFKRDANLRMHMRGHGDEYKTPAALARPDKPSHDLSVVRPRRFSCPFVGCKRNKKHRKFQPLKTMLCVKNHYRRSHCPKRLTCQKCKTKKFSVVADLKTHEKHCGCDKWQCSCGTTFSRKDKLFGHIGLFAGHTPALPFNDVESSAPLDVSDIGDPGGACNPTLLVSGNDGHSGDASTASTRLVGGSGMGLNNSNLQGLACRAVGNSKLSSKNLAGEEISGSSDSFTQSGSLLPESSLLQGLFSPSFLQSTSGGNSSPDGLH